MSEEASTNPSSFAQFLEQPWPQKEGGPRSLWTGSRRLVASGGKSHALSQHPHSAALSRSLAIALDCERSTSAKIGIARLMATRWQSAVPSFCLSFMFFSLAHERRIGLSRCTTAGNPLIMAATLMVFFLFVRQGHCEDKGSGTRDPANVRDPTITPMPRVRGGLWERQDAATTGIDICGFVGSKSPLRFPTPSKRIC